MSNVNQVSLTELWPIMEEQLGEGKKVRFGPKGISMLPLIRQGVDSVVLVKAPQKLKKYDLPLYRRDDGQFVLHRVVAVKKNGYVMCGDNQWVREYGISYENILAIVEGFYRDDEYFSCNEEKYRKYCINRVRRQFWVGVIERKKRTIKNIIRFFLNFFQKTS